MRKVLISLAAAAATVAVAAPASAQWASPAPGYGYGYNAPYGYGYGYNANRFQRELQHIRLQANRLAQTGRLTRFEARDLFGDIRTTERAVYRVTYNGVSPWEARALEQRMQQLRYELRRYADYDGRGYNRGYGYGDRDWDRDDDRGRDRDWGDRDDDHDRDWDRDRR